MKIHTRVYVTDTRLCELASFFDHDDEHQDSKNKDNFLSPELTLTDHVTE